VPGAAEKIMLKNWLERIGMLAMLTATPVLADTTKPTDASAVSPSVQAAAESSNTFALNLYGQLRAADGNLFFSPYSIDAALMMVRAGAAGKTADEITATLNLPKSDPAQPGAAATSLSGRFSSSSADKGYELHVANAMWGQEGTGFLPAYIEQLQKNFSAEISGVDFHDAAAAAKTINHWVEQKTNDRIKDLVDPGSLDGRTKLLLTNAIYFKGDWTLAFDKKSTRDADWNDGIARGADSTALPPKAIPMMSQRGSFEYLKEDGFATLQMPYRGDDLAMLVLLPDDPATGLSQLEKTLDADWLKQITSKLRHDEVLVSFPKFKLDTTYDLNQSLIAIGMPTAFSAAADFSGIDGKRDLVISQVIHKAFVQVDETGTEAAAATVVGMRALAVRKQN
jgi:serpin B